LVQNRLGGWTHGPDINMTPHNGDSSNSNSSKPTPTSQLTVAQQLSTFINTGLGKALPTGVPAWVIPGGKAADPRAPPTLSWTGKGTKRFSRLQGTELLAAVDYPAVLHGLTLRLSPIQIEARLSDQVVERLTSPSTVERPPRRGACPRERRRGAHRPPQEARARAV
jgi:hypothetical protein